MAFDLSTPEKILAATSEMMEPTLIFRATEKKKGCLSIKRGQVLNEKLPIS
jgi:hypothetical protein